MKSLPWPWACQWVRCRIESKMKDQIHWLQRLKGRLLFVIMIIPGICLLPGHEQEFVLVHVHNRFLFDYTSSVMIFRM